MLQNFNKKFSSHFPNKAKGLIKCSLRNSYTDYQVQVVENYEKGKGLMQGRPQRGGGSFPPPETEKIVVERLCYFPELYKMRNVLENWIENG